MFHQTTVIDERKGKVILGDGVDIGPNAVVIGPVRLGDGVKIHAGAIVGGEAEHRRAATDWDKFLTIGAFTEIRELAVVQRGIVDGGGTRVGERCLLMHGAHVGHDGILEDGVTMAPNSVLGGHSILMEECYIGIGAMIHQNRVIGPGVMVGMGSVVTKSIAPYALVYGNPAKIHGTNEPYKSHPEDLVIGAIVAWNVRLFQIEPNEKGTLG